MRKWLKRHKSLVIGIFLVILIGWLVLSCSLWLLSAGSPYVYYEIYPEEKTQNGQPTEYKPETIILNDTLLIGKERIITHKSLEFRTTHEPVQQSGKIPIEKLGTLGDSAGLWNALFSGLALIGVIISIIYQTVKDDKRDRQQQLSQFREEFYRLLDCLSRVVVEIEIHDTVHSGWNPLDSGLWSETTGIETEDYPIKGRECFRYVYSDRPVNSMMSYAERPDEKNHEDLKVYFADYFNHYFRLLYRLLRYVDSVDEIIDDKTALAVKKEYFGIIKAHLSTYELLVAFYNGLLKSNYKAKRLYERACLFDNLDVKYLLFENEQLYYHRIISASELTAQPLENPPEIYYRFTAFTKEGKHKKRTIQSLKFKYKRLKQKLLNKKRQLSEKYYEPLSHEDILFNLLGNQHLSFTQLKKLNFPFDNKTLKNLVNRLVSEGKLVLEVKAKIKYYYNPKKH